MTIRWGQLFGRSDSFGLDLRLFDVPGATSDVEDRSWTGFAFHVGGRNLCAVRDDSGGSESVEWTFLPVAEWFASNWDAIVHEQRFPIDGIPGNEPAALLAEHSSRPPPGASEQEESRRLEAWQAWWSRHALRAGVPGGLLPNAFFRRVGDDIEVSWLNRPFTERYRHLRFAETMGVSAVPVDDFCRVMHQALTAFAGQLDQACLGSGRVHALQQKLATLPKPFEHTRKQRLRLLFGLSLKVIESIGIRLQACAASNGLWEPAGVPALLFGAMAPRLESSDIRRLNSELRQAERGSRRARLLDRHVTDAPCPTGDWWDSRRPWQDAYERALALRSSLSLGDEPVKMDALLKKLGVAVREIRLKDRSIRGIALASPLHAPTILVNADSPWNRGPGGRNATLAHELCHLVVDRDRARRAVVVSGPWAPPRIEQRARAFAAMFLVPLDGLRRLVQAHRGPVDASLLRTIADRFHASTDLVASHLLNLADGLGIPRNEVEDLLTDRMDWTPSDAPARRCS